MTKKTDLAVFPLMIAMLAALPAAAAPGDGLVASDSSSGASTTVAPSGSGEGNIFTPPAHKAGEVPTYTEGNGRGQKLKALMGGKDHLPDFRQIKELPDLTPDQRKQIRDIYSKAKTQLEPIKAQLQDLKQKHSGDEKTTMGDPDAREKFMDLRRQVREIRQTSWQQTKTLLSDKQLQELEQMRHGQMQPATFNPPVVGSAGRRNWRNQMNAQAGQKPPALPNGGNIESSGSMPKSDGNE